MQLQDFCQIIAYSPKPVLKLILAKNISILLWRGWGWGGGAMKEY